MIETRLVQIPSKLERSKLCYNEFMYIVKRLFVVLCLIGVLFVSFNSQPVYAANGVVKTNLFGNIQDDSGGCGVFMIVNFVVDILSMGVAIAGVIGITVAGTTYLTAKDSEEKAKKARIRLLEIVIGLVAYAVMYSGVQWLMPGGKMNPSCKILTDAEVAKIEEEENQNNNQNNSSSQSSSQNNSSSSNSSNNDSNVDTTGATEVGKKMLIAADEVARYFAKNKFIYFQYDCNNGFCNPYMRKGYGPYNGETLTWSRAKKGKYSHCSAFVTVVEKRAGFLPEEQKYHSYIYKGQLRFRNDATKKKLLKYFTIVHGNGEKLSELVKKKKLSPGDVFGYTGRTHTMIYAGHSKGKYWIYEVSGGNNKILKYDGGIHKTVSGSKRVKDILHTK